jgi:UrcA family protein
MKLFSSCIAVALLGLSAGASAKEVVVSYDDLNPSNLADQAKLERRMTSAAREVCDLVARPGSSFASPASVKCFREATEQGRAQIATAVEAHATRSLASRAR